MTNTIDEKENEDWRVRYEAMEASCNRLQREIGELRAFQAIMEAEKRQWVAEKMSMQAIVQQALNSSNATSNAVLEENRALKAEIKRLRG
jgi:hypothetical protein